MTRFVAGSAFDRANFDISFFISQMTESIAQNDVNAVYEGILYQDTLAIQAGQAPDSRLLIIDGNGLQYDINKEFSAGIVTRLLQYRADGLFVWNFTEFALAAIDVNAVIYTAETDDDLDLLDKLLAGDDVILLSREDDTFYAMGGNDDMTGGNGDDTMSGMDGDDVLLGGRGADELSGGLGADAFVYKRVTDSRQGIARDTITDFNGADGDQIDVSVIDANSTKKGHQDFIFIDDNRFSGKAGELRFLDGILSADIDGDRKADFQIELLAVSTLVEDDLVL